MIARKYLEQNVPFFARFSVIFIMVALILNRFNCTNVAFFAMFFTIFILSVKCFAKIVCIARDAFDGEIFLFCAMCRKKRIKMARERKRCLF